MLGLPAREFKIPMFNVLMAVKEKADNTQELS